MKSAHDCSEGGLAVALAECCISGKKQIGARIELQDAGIRPDQLLFNESASRIVLSVAANGASAALSLLEWRGATVRRIGVVGGDQLAIHAGAARFSWPVAELYKGWYSAISDLMSA